MKNMWKFCEKEYVWNWNVIRGEVNEREMECKGGEEYIVNKYKMNDVRNESEYVMSFKK